jgi:hypothetical protein
MKTVSENKQAHFFAVIALPVASMHHVVSNTGFRGPQNFSNAAQATEQDIFGMKSICFGPARIAEKLFLARFWWQMAESVRTVHRHFGTKLGRDHHTRPSLTWMGQDGTRWDKHVAPEAKQYAFGIVVAWSVKPDGTVEASILVAWYHG